jgi:hypothetical protein
MTTPSFDRPIVRRSVQPRSVMNATTARRLVAHLSTTLLLGTVALVAAWQFLFTGAPTEHKIAAPHWNSVVRH